VPDNVGPSEYFRAIVDNLLVRVTCPRSSKSGQGLKVRTPPMPPRENVVKLRNRKIFPVTVPDDVRPGEDFHTIVDNVLVRVTCPRSSKPGQVFKVRPPLDQDLFPVTVPDDVRPGEDFHSIVDNVLVRMTCPRSSKPGQVFKVRPPLENGVELRNQNLFPVTVPDNIRPGEDFHTIVDNLLVRVTCPRSSKPGQVLKVRLIKQTKKQIKGSNPPAYLITIPQGVRAGQNFLLSIDGRTLAATCPNQACPGTVVKIIPPLTAPLDHYAPLPPPSTRKQRPMQLFEVVVPENVTPSKPFRLQN
jgi:hypothetical protein